MGCLSVTGSFLIELCYFVLHRQRDIKGKGVSVCHLKRVFKLMT